ncbi:MAG: DUF6973 domain-containing protein, partial [bacterium]
FRARQIANEVLTEAIAKAPALPGGMAGLRNGPADAWRHARWNQRMINEVGYCPALVAGVGHEVENLFQGSPLSEILMDLHNNAVGRTGENPDSLLLRRELRIIAPGFTNEGKGWYPWRN